MSKTPAATTGTTVKVLTADTKWAAAHGVTAPIQSGERGYNSMHPTYFVPVKVPAVERLTFAGQQMLRWRWTDPPNDHASYVMVPAAWAVA
jgi:hypothetical protein